MLNWFLLSLKLQRYPFKQAQRHLKEIQEVTESEFQAYTDRRKLDILNYHLGHTPYYQKLCGTYTKQWEEIPVLTKQDLQQPLGQRLSMDFKLKDVYVNKTSGSSGHPFTFAKDKYCHALTWANIIARFSNHGLTFGTSKQARFYGIPLEKVGYYKERLKDKLANRYRFPIFNLDDKTLQQYLEKFKVTSFDYINGYTSSLVLFAKYLKSQNCVLTTVCPTLKCCMVTSEMLFDSDRKLMQEWFGVPIINEYGASELDLIAFEDAQGKWRINTETLIVEILDEHDKPVPHGTQGRIVITSLYNKAHPFIRYDIGDLGIIDKTSTPKTMLLKTLVGRTNDIAKLPSGKTVPGLTFYYVTKGIIEDEELVKEFVVKQIKLDTFQIDYVAESALTESKETAIKNAMSTYLEPNLNLILNQKKVLKRTASGKLKQFESKL